MVFRVNTKAPWLTRRDGQPTGPFVLDRDHSLADSLAVFMPLGANNRLNLASPVQGTYDSTLPTVISTLFGGLATHFPGSTNHGINFGNMAYVDTSKPFTIAFWFVLDSLSTPETFPGLFNLTSIGASGQSLECFFSTSANFQGINIGCQNVSWTVIKTDTADADLLGGPHLCVISYNGADAAIISNFTIEIDGASQVLDVPSGFAANIDDNIIGTVGTNDWQGDVFWFRIWQNRQLNAAQRFQLYDPASRWDMLFEPGKVSYFIPVAAIGGATPVRHYYDQYLAGR